MVGTGDNNWQTESTAAATSTPKCGNPRPACGDWSHAHIDAGKTTTSEAILYLTGRIHRAGSVDDGNTRPDWMDQERERGITISAAATTCAWRGCQIRRSTPRHIDFTAEVMRSIRVIDGAVVVIWRGGVETQTETVWRHADEQRLPRLIFVNKLDRDTADFTRALAAIRQQLTPRAIALQPPIGSGKTLRGLVNLLERRALVWVNGTAEPLKQPVPAEQAGEVEQARSDLLMPSVRRTRLYSNSALEGREPCLDALRGAFTPGDHLQPVGAGFLWFLGTPANRHPTPAGRHYRAYLPDPFDMPPVTGELPGNLPGTRHPDLAEPFCASVFKIVTDPHVGHLAWARFSQGASPQATPF